MTSMDSQAKLFKALMHPVRLEILDLLREGEECVCHMEAHLGYRQAYISQQLAVLKETGVIEDRRDGWNVFYRVIAPQVFTLLDAASEITHSPGNQPEQVQDKKVRACPCPKCQPATEGAG